jgi:hypothetical protein
MAIQQAIRPCTCCACTALDRLFPHEGVQLALLAALSPPLAAGSASEQASSVAAEKERPQ